MLVNANLRTQSPHHRQLVRQSAAGSQEKMTFAVRHEYAREACINHYTSDDSEQRPHGRACAWPGRGTTLQRAIRPCQHLSTSVPTNGC